jgi:DNA-binding MarR family transcriptional regulator
VDIESVHRLRVVIARLARRLNVSATHEGLTPTQASVLGWAVKLGPVSGPELVETEGIHPTMLSRVVTRLDDLGLIERLPDPNDARIILIRGTPEGAAKHNRIKADRAAIVSACVDELDDDEAAAILAALPALESLAERLQGGVYA